MRKTESKRDRDRVIERQRYKGRHRHRNTKTGTESISKLLLLSSQQAYKEGLYGEKYVWLLPGWYSANWWEKSTKPLDCTPAQIKQTAGNYIAARAQPLDTVSRATIMGKVSSTDICFISTQVLFIN